MYVCVAENGELLVFFYFFFMHLSLIEIPKLKLDQDLYATSDMNSTLGSVVPMAMFIYCTTYFFQGNRVERPEEQSNS